MNFLKCNLSERLHFKQTRKMGAIISLQPSPRSLRVQKECPLISTARARLINSNTSRDLPSYASKKCATASLSLCLCLSFSLFLPHPSAAYRSSSIFLSSAPSCRAFSRLTRIAINPPFERKRLAMPPEKSCALQLPVLAWRDSHEKTRDTLSDTGDGNHDPPFPVCNVCVYPATDNVAVLFLCYV